MSGISLERIDKTIGIIDKIMETSDSTLRAWSWLVGDHPIVKITFPEPEGHWHYKWRMFKQHISALKEVFSELRFRINVLLHGYEAPCDYYD